jgi:hypothetical protein
LGNGYQGNRGVGVRGFDVDVPTTLGSVYGPAESRTGGVLGGC